MFMKNFPLKELLKLKKQYPDAKIIAHPECKKPVLDYCGFYWINFSFIEIFTNDKSK